jgi:hypothetical protein
MADQPQQPLDPKLQPKLFDAIERGDLRGFNKIILGKEEPGILDYVFPTGQFTETREMFRDLVKTNIADRMKQSRAMQAVPENLSFAGSQRLVPGGTEMLGIQAPLTQQPIAPVGRFGSATPLYNEAEMADVFNAAMRKNLPMSQPYVPGEQFLQPDPNAPLPLLQRQQLGELALKRPEVAAGVEGALMKEQLKPSQPAEMKTVSDENRLSLAKFGRPFTGLDQSQMSQVNKDLFDEKKTLADFRATAQGLMQLSIGGQLEEIQQRARNKVAQEIRVSGPKQILKQWDDLFSQVKKKGAPDLFVPESQGYLEQLKNGGRIFLENMQGIDDRLAMLEAIGTGFRANYVRLTGDVGNFSAVEQENASRYLIPRIWTPSDPLRAPDSLERATKKINLLRDFVGVIESAAGDPKSVKTATRQQLLGILGQAQKLDAQAEKEQTKAQKAEPKATAPAPQAGGVAPFNDADKEKRYQAWKAKHQ